MRYKLWEWEGLNIYGYGFLILLSTFVCIVCLAVLLRLRRQNLSPAVDLTLLMMIGYAALARLFFVLLSGDRAFLEDFKPAKLTSGFWGGQLGLGILAAIYLLTSRARFRALADALAVTWAAITVPHKLGCFLAGCCYGMETSLPWAMVFPADGQCGNPGRPIHPTQLYEAGVALLLAGALALLYLRRLAEGRLILWWGFLFGTLKFGIDWTRGDRRFELAGPLTAAMAVELAVAAVCAALLWRRTLWDRLAEWCERRSVAARIPGNPTGRGISFVMVICSAGLAILAACVTDVYWKKPLAPIAGIFGFYLFINIIACVNPILRLVGYRVVNADGETPSLARLLVRGVAAALTLPSFFGIFRPLFDREGRSLGDAFAGTWLVRRTKATVIAETRVTP